MRTIKVLFGLGILAMSLVDEFGVYISVTLLSRIVIKGMRYMVVVLTITVGRRCSRLAGRMCWLIVVVIVLLIVFCDCDLGRVSPCGGLGHMRTRFILQTGDARTIIVNICFVV
jgi:hypothetical protein